MGSMKDQLGDTLFDYMPPPSAKMPPPAKVARDAALEQVATNAGSDWGAQAIRMIASLPPGEYTGERLRLRLREQGLAPPHHHNAWGALINSAIRKRLLTDTGRRQHMESEKSHARKTPVYRR